MNIRTTILTLAAAILFAAPAFVSAQGGPPPDHRGGPGFGHGPEAIFHHLPMLTEILDLTTDQVDQITAIFESQRTDVEVLMEQMRTAREDFRSSHALGTFDDVAFRTFFESQTAVTVEMRLIQARGFAQAWAVLTPEQQQKLTDLIEARAEGPGGQRTGGKRFGR